MIEVRLSPELLAPRWLAVGGILSRLHLKDLFHAAGAEPAWSVDPHPTRLAAGLLRTEAPWAPAVEAAIETLCTIGSAQIAAPEVAAFLALRAATAADFCLDLELGRAAGGTVTIIPFPDLPAAQVVRWCLIPWWAAHGRRRAALERLRFGLERAGS